MWEVSRWTASVLIRAKGRVANLYPDLFYCTKNGSTNQIAAFKWPLSEIFSKTASWSASWPAEKRKNIACRIQTCVLQASQELGYAAPYMKPGQVEVVLNFVRGRDLFPNLPTGFSKSLCYACLPAAFDAVNKERGYSIAMVITPLRSIMEDQVRKGSG